MVIDTDGSAFITKAEFDSLKNNFQAQIDNYNSSIDSKIDGAIASYLAGIQLSNETQNNLMLWSGKTLGLVEDYRSHVYVDGNVGGKIDLTSWVNLNNDWINGSTQQSGSMVDVSLSYLTFCFHEIKNNGQPFRYLVADYGKIGSTDIWDMRGYASVDETVNMTVFYKGFADYTASGTYSIGLCTGFESFAGIPGRLIKDMDTKVMSICELNFSNLGQARGAAGSAVHNLYIINGNNTEFTSSIVYDDTIRYITNSSVGYTYTDVFPSEWYGLNYTTGHDIHTGKFDLYDMGWRMDETTTNTNFHVKVTDDHKKFYPCGNRAYMRKCKTTYVSYDEERTGWIQRVTSSDPSHRYYDETNLSQLNLFKSNTGSSCKSNNLYSSEIGNTINTKLASKCYTATIGGRSEIVAPLYVGVPLGEVKEHDRVKVNLSFLDNTNYQVGFYIDGFPNGTLAATTATDAGCAIEGTTSHVQSIAGPLANKTITLNIKKSGILFFKFGATTTSTKGTIKLPDTFTVIKEN